MGLKFFPFVYAKTCFRSYPPNTLQNFLQVFIYLYKKGRSRGGYVVRGHSIEGFLQPYRINITLNVTCPSSRFEKSDLSGTSDTLEVE